jgi:hypothetical protein
MGHHRRDHKHGWTSAKKFEREHRKRTERDNAKREQLERSYTPRPTLPSHMRRA